MFGCEDCERRRQWLKERARRSAESIQRALAALANRTAKPSTDSAEQSVDHAERQAGERTDHPGGSDQ